MDAFFVFDAFLPWKIAAISLFTVNFLFLFFYIHKRKNWHSVYVNEKAQQQVHFDQMVKQYDARLDIVIHQLAQSEEECVRLRHEVKTCQGKLLVSVEKLRYLSTLKQEKDSLTDDLHFIQQEKNALALKLKEQEIRTEEQLSAASAKITLLKNAEEHLRVQFEALANRVFDHKAQQVDEHNKLSLETLLGPLKAQIEGFRKQVNDGFGEQAKERHTMLHEIKNLQQLNQDLTQEAVNLTQALKGNNKQQGNWGEVILARVLEESGLREGHEYHTQVTLENEQGQRFQPDVIVRLPQGKDVVIDAKMALVSYERYFNTEDTKQRAQALTDHISAIRTHIRGLSRKDYHQLHGIKSLDYVLMFIPIEPAFQLAIASDKYLIRDALHHNIMLVSPTTLVVALRTINNLWRYEYQNQNAKLIAEKAAKLYDKLRLFIDDMENIGSSLNKASESYHSALLKLAHGKGNILRQAESFKSLGVEVKRDINLDVLTKQQDVMVCKQD